MFVADSTLTIGTHKITIIDSLGCKDSMTFEIKEPEKDLKLEFVSHKHVDCPDPDDLFGTVTVYLKPSGGWEPYTYTFDNENPTGDSLTYVKLGDRTVYISDSLGCKDTLEFKIEKPEPLKITLLKKENVKCFKESNGSLKIKASGGVPDPTDPNDPSTGYKYAWKDAQDNIIGTVDSIENLKAGWYYIEISDSANLCTKIDSFEIIQPDTLTVNEITNLTKNVSCFNGTDGEININVEGGTTPYTYSWSHDPNNTTLIIKDINATTIYKVTVTDDNNCTVSDDFSVTQPELLVASIDNFSPAKCYGEANGSALSSAIGGNGNYTYLWDDASQQTTVEANNLSVGSYKVIITDPLGCKDSAEVVIPQPDKLKITLEDLTHLSCFGKNDGTAIVSATGGNGGDVFSWSNGETGTSANNLPFGTQFATVTDNKGCEDVIDVFINQPPKITTVFFAAATQNVKCYGEASGTTKVIVTGGTEPYSYTWSDGQTNETAVNLSSGKYYITIKDAKNCEVSDSITILDPPALTVSVNAEKLKICPYEPAQLHSNATGGVEPLTVTWGGTFNAWDISTFITSDTTFQATVTDANGCKDSAQVHLTVSILPTPIFNDNERNECLYSTIAYNNLSTGDFIDCEWRFSNGEVFNECGTLFFETTTLGYQDITLKLVNADGCEVEHTGYNILYTRLNPKSAFETDKDRYDVLETNVYFNNLSANATNYVWHFGDMSNVSTAESPKHEYSYWQEGTYDIFLVAIDSISGCADTSVQTITIYETEIFYIPNTFTPNNDGANDTFKPVITAGVLPRYYQFEIYNRWGERIFETQNIFEGWDGSYKGETQKSEVYTWRVRIQHKDNAKRQEFVGHVNLFR